MIDLDSTKLDLDNIKTVDALNVALDAFSDRFTCYWEGCAISQRGREAFSQYLIDLGLTDCFEALDIAMGRMDNSESTLKYTIGILKNWKKNGKPSYGLVDKVGVK